MQSKVEGTFNSSWLSILVVVLLSLAACSDEQMQAPEAAKSAFEEVLATNTIRAAYVAYPPGTIVEPGGQNVRGIFPDLLRSIAKSADMKVEFTEEVGYADLIEGLRTNRYDIVGGVWANPNRAKSVTLSMPVYYSVVGVWVRKGDTRFTEASNWASVNDPNVRIAAIDGSTPLNIIKSQFPNANLTTYPNLTSEAQLFLDLAQGKIDVFLAEPAQGALFDASNPGLIENIAVANPIRAFANVFLLPPEEMQFKTFIDAAISDQLSAGRVKQLIDEYQPIEGALVLPPQPYVTH